MEATDLWHCPNCEIHRATPFCEQCGEEPLRRLDLTLRDIAGQFVRTFSSVDGRLLKSFGALLTAPGAITVAHLNGQRRSFIGPLPLFLIANGLFFAVQSLTYAAIFSSPLSSHLHGQDWSVLAQSLVDSRLSGRRQALADYAPLFDAAVVLNAKALIFLMALAFAPLLPLMFYRAHRPAGVHIVFALHLYAFLLLLFCFSLLVAQASFLAGRGGLEAPGVDLLLSLFNLAICLGYLYRGRCTAAVS